MARQNVGNPKFYINLPTYYMAKGMGSSADSNYAKVFDFNPSNVYKEFTHLGGSNAPSFRFNIHWRTALSNHANAKFFIGMFGHNFEALSIYQVDLIYKSFVNFFQNYVSRYLIYFHSLFR